MAESVAFSRQVRIGVSISSALGTKKRRNPQLAYSGECADYVFLLIDSSVLAGSKSLVLASVHVWGLSPQSSQYNNNPETALQAFCWDFVEIVRRDHVLLPDCGHFCCFVTGHIDTKLHFVLLFHFTWHRRLACGAGT